MYSTARMTVIQTEGADIVKILEICINVLNQGRIQCIYICSLYTPEDMEGLGITVELKMIQDVINT